MLIVKMSSIFIFLNNQSQYPPPSFLISEERSSNKGLFKTFDYILIYINLTKKKINNYAVSLSLPGFLLILRFFNLSDILILIWLHQMCFNIFTNVRIALLMKKFSRTSDSFIFVVEQSLDYDCLSASEIFADEVTSFPSMHNFVMHLILK